MDNVTVTKEALLESLTANRTNHRSEFLAAQQGWKAVILEELERRLADARAGRKVHATFNFPEPQDHTKAYDRVIRMVEMEVNDTIEMAENDFAMYVMDDWEWKAQWTVSNAVYTSGR